MNRAYATFRLPDGRSCSLGVGELVGRLWSAALQIDDPRVSEGHAMLSLRSGDLWLLALRRRLAVEGRSVAEVRLVAGQRIGLAQGIELVVEAVELPATALAIEAPGLPTMILPGLCSLQVRPQIQVFARYEVDAACLLWDTDDGWRRAQGLPAVCLDWGPWSEVGMAAREGALARAEALGLGALSPVEGAALFGRLLAARRAHLAVVSVHWTRFGGLDPLFRRLAVLPSPDRSPSTALRDAVAAAFSMPPDTLDLDTSLVALGLDPVIALDLKSRIHRLTGLDLPVAELLRVPTTRDLMQRLPAPPPEAADVDALSDAEVEALLNQMLAAEGA